jgi:hypothetical protein
VVAYLKIIASVVPKDMNINVGQYDDWTDEQLIARLRQLHGEPSSVPSWSWLDRLQA